MASTRTFLTSVLDRDEWSVSSSCRFTPGDRAPGAHCIAGWIGSRVDMKYVGKRKCIDPTGNRTPVVRPVAQSLQ
jgi:hypothetical protein